VTKQVFKHCTCLAELTFDPHGSLAQTEICELNVRSESWTGK
jgi:hypothetical protein